MHRVRPSPDRRTLDLHVEQKSHHLAPIYQVGLLPAILKCGCSQERSGLSITSGITGQTARPAELPAFGYAWARPG